MSENTAIPEKIEFETDVTAKDMLNFKLYHNYHSISGIATLLIGIVFLIICVASFGHYNIVYTLMMAFFGLFFTVYTPIGMKLKVRKQMKSQEDSKYVMRYTITQENITVSQGEDSAVLSWDDVFRMKATGSSVILYITSVRANIIPFRCLGGKAEDFMRIAQSRLTPYQIKVNSKKLIKKCSGQAVSTQN